MGFWGSGFGCVQGPSLWPWSGPRKFGGIAECCALAVAREGICCSRPLACIVLVFRQQFRDSCRSKNVIRKPSPTIEGCHAESFRWCVRISLRLGLGLGSGGAPLSARKSPKISTLIVSISELQKGFQVIPRQRPPCQMKPGFFRDSSTRKPLEARRASTQLLYRYSPRF